jgi:RNA recognition motif-containing protein
VELSRIFAIFLPSRWFRSRSLFVRLLFETLDNQRSVTDSSQRETKFKHSTDLDRRSLFVKNVDYSASEEEVRALFAQVGGHVASVCLGVSRDFTLLVCSHSHIPWVTSAFQYGAVRDLRTVTKFDGKKRDFYYIDVSFCSERERFMIPARRSHPLSPALPYLV